MSTEETSATEVVEVEGEVVAEDPGQEGSEAGETGQEEQEEIVVSIGEQEPPQEEEKAPEWVRELRKKNREDQKRIRELEAKLAEKEPAKPKLGPKPTLASCEYDDERFEQELTAWHEQKRSHEAEEAKASKAKEDAEKAWQDRLAGYEKAKKEIRVRDFEEAEEAVTQYLDVTQQGVVIHGAENPAIVIYALGKNPAKAKELAEIKDPVKFAFAVAKLETQLKVSSKKPPAPEKVVTGTARISGAVDSTLERLRKEAEKTGDMTKVIAYKREQKRKSNA